MPYWGGLIAESWLLHFGYLLFVSSLSDDVINAVPQAMHDGAYAIGVTPNETIWQVVIPADLPGLILLTDCYHA
jgi:ABC-type phosphate transport system permease subunit